MAKWRYENFIIILLFCILYSSSCQTQKQTTEEKLEFDQRAYFAQTRPGTVPIIFAPNFISKKERYEFGSVFSKDGNEMFIGVQQEDKAEIYQSELKDGKWTELRNVIQSEVYSYNDPMLSPDESKLYFISDHPVSGTAKNDDYDIWYVERQGMSWSKPINAGTAINTDYNEYYISFSKNGKMYFSSNKNAEKDKGYDFDIYASECVDGEFQNAMQLGSNINSGRYEADVFISPDESYIIFCARRRDGYGQGDLYISFKNANGDWSPSKNMGSIINSEHHELCPFVSNDGKYFFYTSNKDIYWVSTKIFQQMK